MNDDTENIPSPCVMNCCLNEDDVCLGCFRIMTEIIAWGEASNIERKVILERAKNRAKDSDSSYRF